MAALTSLALAASGVIESLRKKYSSKNPSPAQPADAPARVIIVMSKIILIMRTSIPCCRVVGARFVWNQIPVRTFDLAAIGHIIRVVLLHVHLAVDEKIHVVAGQALIERAR